MRVGIVIALEAEARTWPRASGSFAKDHHYEIMLAGPGPRRAAQAARELLGAGCDALLSFGLAGGLAPALRPGTLLNATAVHTGHGQILPCAASLQTLLRESLAATPLHSAALYGADAPVVARTDKQALLEQLGAVAVDMESSAIAIAAHERDVPFAVLRCVVDPGDFTLPHAALVGMAEDGANRPWASAVAVLRRPWELPDLVRLALWYGGALRALRSAAALLCK